MAAAAAAAGCACTAARACKRKEVWGRATNHEPTCCVGCAVVHCCLLLLCQTQCVLFVRVCVCVCVCIRRSRAGVDSKSGGDARGRE